MVKIKSQFDRCLYKISKIGILATDSENATRKKIAITLLPFYVSLPALVLAGMYLYFGNISACLIPCVYLIVSVLSTYFLYKTKKFFYFETIQLLMILFLPFVLMWTLGGFDAGSFVFIWAFYAPIAATIYSEHNKLEITWFILFIILVLVSIYMDSYLIDATTSSFPKLISDLFLLVNIGAGLGGLYFLVSHFISEIKNISIELKRDRESLYNLTNNLQSVNKELEYLANSDIVTNLPNRLYFMDIAKSVFQRADANKKKVAIIFLDLDGFKAVNDTLGHEAGDLILKVVGGRLRSVIRTSDTVARVGGDEFAIYLCDITDKVHVEQICKVMIKEVNELCHYKGNECHVGVSIGVSFYPDDGEDIDTLMKKADDAMYDVKKIGKNNFLFYKE